MILVINGNFLATRTKTSQYPPKTKYGKFKSREILGNLNKFVKNENEI